MKEKLFNFTMLMLILLILIEIALLTVPMRQRKNINSQFNSPVNLSSALLLNSYAPPIRAINLDNEIETIDFSRIEKMSLLFILPPSCTLCENNFIFWNRLSIQLKGKIYGIGLIVSERDGAKIIHQFKKLNFPLYTPENKVLFVSDYKFSWLPYTILINKEGVIQWIKVGNLSRDDYLEIKRLIHENLR